jgi:hypothetical protein
MNYLLMRTPEAIIERTDWNLIVSRYETFRRGAFLA